MTQITLDASVSSQLERVIHTVETDLAEWEPLSPDISEEELDRRANSKEKRYTTTEVLAHLERL